MLSHGLKTFVDFQLLQFKLNIMEYTITKFNAVDVGFHSSNIEPKDGIGRVGKAGIDKSFTLEQMIEIAKESNANIIVKGGENAKWYLKRVEDKDALYKGIESQEWRDTSRCTMWYIQWN